MLRQRKKLRLEWYDYSSNGYYFITICTHNRENYFWEIIEWKMILNQYWDIVQQSILDTDELRKNIEIDEFIVMPNHVHLILVIVGFDSIEPIKNVIEPIHNTDKNNITWEVILWLETMQSEMMQSGTMQSFPTVSRVIRWLKWNITSKINKIPEIREWFGWQKSFFDKIIRNDDQLNKTRQYIIDNPVKWELDSNNPINIKNHDNK